LGKELVYQLVGSYNRHGNRPARFEPTPEPGAYQPAKDVIVAMFSFGSVSYAVP
jgi:hypothetical protein